LHVTTASHRNMAPIWILYRLRLSSLPRRFK